MKTQLHHPSRQRNHRARPGRHRAHQPGPQADRHAARRPAPAASPTGPTPSPPAPRSPPAAAGGASTRSARASGPPTHAVAERSGPSAGTHRGGSCVVSSFDLVCHQRLAAKLAQRVGDRRLLGLIGRMLKAKVVLPDGVVIASEQGVPQGGPLSPLLSNIVLDELDQELDRRGHRFARYADDAKVYVRSERAGQRVMTSLTEFIQRRLRLRLNEAKSAVARPEDRHFLGFRLRLDPQSGTVEVLLSERTKRNAMQKVKQLTPRTWGNTLIACISALNACQPRSQ